MSLIQCSIVILGRTEDLFALTQDYGRRLAWDPFPESYRFHDGLKAAEAGAVLTVNARNGYSMTVRYVSFSRPRAAAIEMVSGPWFIGRFAGTWHFAPVDAEQTRVTFKYNVVAAPRILRWLIQPLLNRAFNSHANARLQALKAYVEGDAGSLL